MKIPFLVGVATLFVFAPLAHSQIIFSSQGFSQTLQGGGGSFGGGGAQLPTDMSRLLRLPQIKEELRLQSDQLEAISKLSNVMRREMSSVFRNVDFSEGDTNGIVQEAQRAIRIKTEEKLEEVLTPPQLKRLKQIKIQNALTAGATSLLKGELEAEIALSDKQKTHLKDLDEKKQAELNQEIKALREKYREETLSAVLTDSQMRKLKKISGEAYEIKRPDFRSSTRARNRPAESNENSETPRNE